MTDAFSRSDLATLREHRVALFQDRVIFDAQPPMEERDIVAVQAVCSGPIPQPLIDLWRTTAGGSLDYDLMASMSGNREALSWCELFYNGSESYHDLRGWIDHELALAVDVAESNGVKRLGKLEALPIGGFEYTDRIYVVVQRGEEHGHVIAWKYGLPPAWTHQLHKDSIAKIGTDLRSAFAALHLSEDPLAPTQDYFAGQSFIEYVTVRVNEYGLDRALADRLIAFYRGAIRHWRPALAAGELATQPELALQALEHAIRADDPALLAQLKGVGVPFDKPVFGDALPLSAALMCNAYRVAHALLDSGAAVPATALNDVDGLAPTKLVELLIARGAEATVEAVIHFTEFGAIHSARLIARAYIAKHRDFEARFIRARKDQIDKLTADLKRVRAGTLGHYLGEDGLQAHIEALRTFRL